MVKLKWNRLLAKFTDYGLLYLGGVVLSLILPTDFSDLFFLVFGLLVPAIWVPIEALLLSWKGTTPGKALFGLKVTHKKGRLLTFKEALDRGTHFSNREGVVFEEEIPKWRFGISILLALACGSTLFLGKEITDVAVQFEQGVAASSGWIQYSPEDGKFSVALPKKPQLEQHELAESTPKTPLNLNEYKVEGEPTFSVSYLELPRKWRIFSSNMLLKAAINIVIAHMPGSKLIDKQIVKHKNYPALNFKAQQGDNEIEGRLIIVGSTLYKLSIEYPKKKAEDSQKTEQQEAFLNSFELNQSAS